LTRFFEVMTHVDHGLTNVSGFDSADPVISINDANLKHGASQRRCPDLNFAPVPRQDIGEQPLLPLLPPPYGCAATSPPCRGAPSATSFPAPPLCCPLAGTLRHDRYSPCSPAPPPCCSLSEMPGERTSRRSMFA
jgi:hypothetical protein